MYPEDQKIEEDVGMIVGAVQIRIFMSMIGVIGPNMAIKNLINGHIELML